MSDEKVDLTKAEDFAKFVDRVEAAAKSLEATGDLMTSITGLRDENKGLAERVEKAEQLLATLEAAKAEKARSIPKMFCGKNEGRQEVREKFSVLKFISAIKDGFTPAAIAKHDAGFEAEIHTETQKKWNDRMKALGTGDTAGGYLLPEEHSGDFIQYLYDNSAAINLGARVITDLTDQIVNIPRLDTKGTAAWFTAGSSITAADHVFGNVGLTPSKVAARVLVNNELFRRRSVPQAEGVIMEDFAMIAQEALDLAALEGTGSGGQPTGIANTSGIGTVTTSGTLNYAKLLSFITTQATANALRGRLGWACHPGIAAKIFGLVDGSSRPLFNQVLANRDNPNGALPMALLGYKMEWSSQMTPGTASPADGILIFGNWAELMVGLWGGVRLEASADAGFANDQTHVRMILEADTKVRHPASFTVASDVDG